MFNQANKSAIFNRSFDVLLEVNSNKKIVKELENMDEKEILVDILKHFTLFVEIKPESLLRAITY